jgi:3-deoxy-D-manno-octulosonic-acid transferase
MQDKIQEQLEKAFTEEDIIEGVPAKSIEEIIREVAEEEGMTEEEVAEAIEKLSNLNFSLAKKQRHTKAKRNKAKEKAKKKQAKKSKKRNR